LQIKYYEKINICRPFICAIMVDVNKLKLLIRLFVIITYHFQIYQEAL